jgi:uncharacterized RDD family membrane protein YckC
MHMYPVLLMLGRQRFLLLDFLTTPFDWFANIVQYSLIFMAIIILVLTIGAVVAIPLGLKLLGVAFAKTIVVETSKVLKDIGITNIDLRQSKETQKMKAYLDRKVVPILSKSS